MTGWQVKGSRRAAMDAAFVALGMMLSYLEYLLPLHILLPLPGIKLGLANPAVILCWFLLSPADAVLVSAARILLSGILFGNLSSLYFSAMGGLCALLSLSVTSKLREKCSFLGISVLSAAAHNLGQMLAATTLFGAGIFLSYLPVLLAAGTVFGSCNGVLLNLIFPRIQKIWERTVAG